MKWILKIIILLLVVILISCKEKKLIDRPFVLRSYSNITTEILDHIFLELVRESRCYEDFITYQARTKEWETNDTVKNNKLFKSFLENRKSFDKQQVILIKNELPLIEMDSTNLRYLKSDINRPLRDEHHITPDGKTQVFWLDSRKKQIYSTLLNNIKLAKVAVLEMKNTGCLQVQPAIIGRAHHSIMNLPYLEGNQEVCGYLTISEAVISKDGKEGCLYYEFVAGPKEGIGCIIFVQKINGRWRLIREIMHWIS